MNASNFQLVSIINAIAGNSSHSTWEQLDQQMKIINGEHKELGDGIAKRDLFETVDGGADTLVTVYGALFRVGVDADAIMQEVCASLLTRFDRTAEDQQKTEAKYSALGIATECVEVEHNGEQYFVTRSASDQVHEASGEKFPKGKFLKSYQFRQPNLRALIPQAVIDRLMPSGGEEKHPI